jgi:hypothetical protein
MSLVLTAPSKFPAGTSVAAHIRSHWPTVPERPTGVPAGAAAETATVQTNRTLTFSALAAGTKYYLYAQVGGVNYVVAIDTGGTSTSNPEFKEGMTDGQVPVWNAANERFEGGSAGSGTTIATDTLWNAKGDLAAGTGSDTAARVAAGANGTFLVADSAQSAGVKWVAPTGFGTSLPASPADNDRYFWEVDATNGVVWHMIWNAALSKWLFLGGPPLWSQVDTSETTASTTYVALTTAGPSITIPGAGGGLYLVGLGAEMVPVTTVSQRFSMSYDIGATGAVDADRTTVLKGGANEAASAFSLARFNRKSFATAAALVAKYKVSANTATFLNRWMSLLPVQVNPS